MSNCQDVYVAKSPDSGDTMHARRFNDVLGKEGSWRKNMLRSQLWRDIFQAAETDPVLKDMIEKVEVYHQLKDLP